MLQVSITGKDPARVGNRSRDGAIQGVYRCLGDDRWCAIRAETDAEWTALAGTIGAPGRWPTLASAHADHDAVDAAIEAWTSAREAAEVMADLQARGVAAGVVASGDDLLSDPQLNRRGFIRHLDQPGVGEMVIAGLPLEIDPPMIDEPGPAAMLGQDNE